MGAKQGLENVVDAARIADDRGINVRFVLVGDGNRRKALELHAEGVQRIEFKDPLESDDYLELLACADVLLVNELPGVGEMAVPSKLTSYFSAGRPIVAATDTNGVTAQEILDSRAGIVVSAGDPIALLDTSVNLASDIEAGRRLGSLGQQYARRLLGVDRAIDNYEDWVHRLTAKSST
jgi:glycosyltransferase involved in cell wall biosynthesis